MVLQRVAVSYLSDDDSLEVVTEDGTATKVGGGDSQPGASVVRGPFSFAFDTAGLVDGIPFYTPTIGDVLLDLFVLIDTLWDGDSLGDVGAFASGQSFGYFGAIYDTIDFVHQIAGNTPNNMTVPGAARTGAHPATDVVVGSVALPAATVAQPVLPAVFLTADPLKVCVSDNGQPGGGATGATQGAARIYIVTASPAALP